MGFKYTHRVYNDVHDTTATEQQVLALLAHFADDKTGQCFPSIETLARQSHLHRATVMRSLDSLKGKGYLKWITGGRKKRGRVLSNLYKLTLPKPTPKRNETVLSEFWEDVDNSQSRVAHCDGYPSHSATPHSRTTRPLPVAQRDSIIYRSSKENPDGHNPPQEAADVEMPGRFAFGVARRDGSAEGLSPPRCARDKNATTPTPEGDGSCGHAFRLESLPATGTSPGDRVECACSKWTLHEVLRWVARGD